jgi:hypothetical protein
MSFCSTKSLKFARHLSLTLAGQQSVTQVIAMVVVNFVTPKGSAKHELLFNTPASVNQTFRDSLNVQELL